MMRDRSSVGVSSDLSSVNAPPPAAVTMMATIKTISGELRQAPSVRR